MKKKLIKDFASYVAISFFFASIFILIFYFTLQSKIDFFISLINTTAVKENNEEVKVSYNFEAKKLLKYPDYGQKYGELSISSINLKLPVYFGDNTKILRKGVGHYAGSYFPGESGTIILAAHNNVGYFNKLDKVSIGDVVNIKTTYGDFSYQIDSFKIIKETDLSAFPIQHNEELLIMYTCYPLSQNYGRTTKRYVVYAKKIGDV